MNTAQITTDGDRQLVVLPNGITIEGTEVYVQKLGSTIILVSKEEPWRPLLDSLDQFSDDFMNERVQPPLENREAF